MRGPDEFWAAVCDHLKERRQRGWWFDDDRREWCFGLAGASRLIVRQPDAHIVELRDNEPNANDTVWSTSFGDADSFVRALPAFEQRRRGFSSPQRQALDSATALDTDVLAAWHAELVEQDAALATD